MTSRVVIIFPGNDIPGEAIREGIHAEKGEIMIRRFPDGESYVRLISDVFDRDVIVVASLHDPDDKFLSLVFLLRLIREAGAAKVTLVAPYLPYMRQDKQFKPGEAVTSTYFGEILSPFFDELITIDPHLHRRHSMSEIYAAPSKVLHASTLISAWIKRTLQDAVLIGPDVESEQWVSEVSQHAGVPFIILNKERYGDRNVHISFPEIEKYKGHTPVLVDDIISTAHTMVETVKHLKTLGFKAPVCIGVHAIFADAAFEELKNAGVNKIVTCNTIPHESNGIDVSPLIIQSLMP